MATSQKQSAADGATAIQASGSVTVNNGLSVSQMGEIISHLSSHVNTLVQGTKAEVEGRLKAFESGLLERFVADKTARSEAFSEPDFLAATLDAQKAYARSGDEGLRQVLTDLVAQRSKISERSRLSLTLNDAIAKVGSIPEPDLNALSLIFVFQNTQYSSVTNFQDLAFFLSTTVKSLISKISTSKSSSDYLAAHGCTIPPSGIGIKGSAFEILSNRYGAAIAKGAKEEDIRSAFPDYDRLLAIGLVVDSPYGEGLKKFATFGESLEAQLPSFGIFYECSTRYLELIKSAKPTEQELVQAIKPYCPEIESIFEKYNSDSIRNSALTSIGIALAHANLKDGPVRHADLSIWIQP